tara:strand:+ start:1951 stop:2568 length:618 start_codon:yes stop_codon:yes gene_type:complete
MSKIRVQEIEHTASSNTNPAIALNANNNVTFDAGVTATSFTGDGANLTNVPAPSTFNAANLTGTLPAIDGSALTGVADATKLPLTGGTVTGVTTFDTYVRFNESILEGVYAVTSAASITFSPYNGSIQTLTLGHSPSVTLSMSSGQSMLLLVTAGSSYTMTFNGNTPAIKWVGGSAPTLSTTDVTAIEFWQVGTQVYGAAVGDLS